MSNHKIQSNTALQVTRYRVAPIVVMRQRPPELVSEAASTSIGAFAWADVLVSGVVLIAFILVEGSRARMKMLWLPILGTCAIGISFGLPLFLLQRELHLERVIGQGDR